MTLHYTQLCQTQLITLCVQYHFDDEVKDDTHGAVNPEMMKVSSSNLDRNICSRCDRQKHRTTHIKELAWFVYKVFGVM
jgi:hypothetical protein